MYDISLVFIIIVTFSLSVSFANVMWFSYNGASKTGQIVSIVSTSVAFTVYGMFGVDLFFYDHMSVSEREVYKTAWIAVYWVSLGMYWAVCRVQLGIEASGWFTFREVLFDSLYKNIVFALVCLSCLVFATIIVSVGNGGFMPLETVFICVQVFGLFLFMLILAQSIVDVPRKLWRKAYIEQRIAQFEIDASVLSDELDEAKNDLDESILCLGVFSECTDKTRDAYEIIERLVDKVGRTLRPCNGDEEQDRKKLAQIHRNVKLAVETILISNTRLDALARRYAFELLLRSNSESSERHVHAWKRRTRVVYRIARSGCYIACAVVAWCMTLALLWCETTIWTRHAFSLDLCIFSNFPALSAPFLAYTIWCVSQSNALTWWRVRQRAHMATDMKSMVLLSSAVLAISFSCIKNFIVLLNGKNTAFGDAELSMSEKHTFLLYMLNIGAPVIILVVSGLYSIPCVERAAFAAKNSMRAFKLTRETGVVELVSRIHQNDK